MDSQFLHYKVMIKPDETVREEVASEKVWELSSFPDSPEAAPLQMCVCRYTIWVSRLKKDVLSNTTFAVLEFKNILYVCVVCVAVCCAHDSRCLWRPAEGSRPSGAARWLVWVVCLLQENKAHISANSSLCPSPLLKCVVAFRWQLSVFWSKVLWNGAE